MSERWYIYICVHRWKHEIEGEREKEPASKSESESERERVEGWKERSSLICMKHVYCAHVKHVYCAHMCHIPTRPAI